MFIRIIYNILLYILFIYIFSTAQYYYYTSFSSCFFLCPRKIFNSKDLKKRM